MIITHGQQGVDEMAVIWVSRDLFSLWLCQHGYWKWMNMAHLPIKNGDLPIENGDLPTKNGDLSIKSGVFP